jgi:hypothetical protein
MLAMGGDEVAGEDVGLSPENSVHYILPQTVRFKFCTTYRSDMFGSRKPNGKQRGVASGSTIAPCHHGRKKNGGERGMGPQWTGNGPIDVETS